MTKHCFAWGIAVVATLALLGVATAYPAAGGAVSDEEAAQLVGASCFSCVTFNQKDCDDQDLCPGGCWSTDLPCGSDSWWEERACGGVDDCNKFYCDIRPCVQEAAPDTDSSAN